MARPRIPRFCERCGQATDRRAKANRQTLCLACAIWKTETWQRAQALAGEAFRQAQAAGEFRPKG